METVEIVQDCEEQLYLIEKAYAVLKEIIGYLEEVNSIAGKDHLILLLYVVEDFIKEHQKKQKEIISALCEKARVEKTA